MNRRAREHLLLQNRLHQALGNGELSLHFQPQLEIGTDRILGVEALLRWHNRAGPVPPGRFIPVAEDSRPHRAYRRLGAGRGMSAGPGVAQAPALAPCPCRSTCRAQFRRAGLVEEVLGVLEETGLPTSSA